MKKCHSIRVFEKEVIKYMKGNNIAVDENRPTDYTKVIICVKSGEYPNRIRTHQRIILPLFSTRSIKLNNSKY